MSPILDKSLSTDVILQLASLDHISAPEPEDPELPSVQLQKDHIELERERVPKGEKIPGS